MAKIPGSKFILHFIVLIWGFTAILGKIIEAPASVLVWYRMIIAVAGILGYMLITKQEIKTDRKNLQTFFIVGGIIALHWVLFYRAIKVSNVSVTLACFSSGAFFASFLEPIFFKRKLRIAEMVYGLSAFFGIYLIFRFTGNYWEGIFLSLGAAFLSALFTVLNGKLIKGQVASKISLYELLSGFIIMTIYFLISGNLSMETLDISAKDWFYLIVMGLVCTAFAFVASIDVMRELSPYTVVLTVNLEPVYGIILATLIFGSDERMEPGFYLGAGVILVTLLLNSRRRE